MPDRRTRQFILLHFALDAAALPLLPLLMAQGRRVKRDTPRLPPAGGPVHGVVDGAGAPLRLLVIGESTVAGVGAARHDEALTGQLARALQARYRRRVEWHAFGLSGATVAHASRSLTQHLPQQPMDLIVMAFGVNDTIERTVPKHYAQGLEALVGAARSRMGASPPAVLCAAPPMHLFPALPAPLRHFLGARAMLLNRAVRFQHIDRTHIVALTVKAERHLFASDGFHPSPAGYAAWGEGLAHYIEANTLIRALP